MSQPAIPDGRLFMAYPAGEREGSIVILALAVRVAGSVRLNKTEQSTSG